MGSQRVGHDWSDLAAVATAVKNKISSKTHAIATPAGCVRKWGGLDLEKQGPKVCSNGTPLQYSCLENPMDGGVWWAAVHGVAKSRTRQSNFTFTFHFHVLEKEIATHSSIPAWRISGTGEPSGLLSMGLHRVRHDWSDLAAAAMFVD